VILVDTSIWIDHLRKGDPGLASLLRDGRVLAHTFVIGELAMGQVSQRQEILQLLADLPHAEVASADEVMALVESRQLFGVGIGYVDAHLLASTLLTSGARLWTRDKRLAATASTLGLTAGVPTG
jgi:predicted nucleic acid-binding protein